jgi:hypothetical protein
MTRGVRAVPEGYDTTGLAVGRLQLEPY